MTYFLSKLNKPYKRVALIFSATCLFIVWTNFFIWFLGRYPAFSLSNLSAFLITLIFSVLGIKFSPIFFKALMCKTENSSLKNKCDKRQLIKVFIKTFCVGLFVILLGYIINLIAGKSADFYSYLKIFSASDGRHYLDIARDWYQGPPAHNDRLVQIVFFPLYPILIKLFSFLFFDYLISALAVSILCFCTASTLLYYMVNSNFSKKVADNALWFLYILPGGFFFFSVMSESLFLLLSLCCIYFAQKRNFLLSSVFACLSWFTRSAGLCLLFVVLYEMFCYMKEKGYKKNLLKLLYLPIIPLGFISYCLINYLIFSDPFKFMEYQLEHWGQSISWFFNTAAYQTDYLISSITAPDFRGMFALWIPGLFTIFASIIVILLNIKKLPTAYILYFILYYGFSMGATWLLSATRYMIVMFPLAISLSLISYKKRLLKIILMSFLFIIYVLYFYMFLMRLQVW